MPTKVTDPALLEQLEGGSASGPVTDPALLSQLNGLSPQARQFAVTDKPGYIEQFAGGAKHAWDRAASGVANVFTDRPDLKELVNQGKAFVNETGPTSTVGQVGGDIAMTLAPGAGAYRTGQLLSKTLGRFAPVAAEAGAMAGYGALTADEGQGTQGAAAGALGTVGGHALGRAAKGLVTPTPAARELQARGVTLTPGQAAGPGTFTNRVEQWAASNPMSSVPIRNAQREAIEEANVAAAESVARMVDSKVRLGLPPREAVEQTRDLISKTYDDALTGVTAPTEAVYSRLQGGLA